MVAKNSHPSPNGHLQKRASGLLRIITGHFALFVNTTEGGFWKTEASIYFMFLLARGSLISLFTFSSSSIFTSYGRVLCSWCCLFLFWQILPARHNKNVSKLPIFVCVAQWSSAKPFQDLTSSILLDFATPPFMATILDLNLICPYELHQLFLHNKGYIHHPQTTLYWPWSSAPTPTPCQISPNYVLLSLILCTKSSSFKATILSHTQKRRAGAKGEPWSGKWPNLGEYVS